MRLRKQLFFASLFTLSLPWVGCQYIQQMEENLLTGQAAALRATADAIAATIENTPRLSDTLEAFSATSSSRPLYLHPFYSPLILDGYSEDWASYGYSPQNFPSRRSVQTSAQVFGGLRGDQAWLLFKIPSADISYFNPSANIDSAHRLRLSFVIEEGQIENRVVIASGPGNTQVYQEPKTTEPPKIIDHRINGIWREYEQGFQIELLLPFELVSQGLSFELLGPDDKLALFTNIESQKNRSKSTHTQFQIRALE